MQYLFIIFGFHILQIYSKSKTCEIQQIQNKITCHEYILNCFLLEGNEEDYYQLKSIDKQIIQKSFTIPYKNIPISYNIFNTLDYGKLQEKMMCSLFLNSNYYITCMNFDTLNYEKLNSNLQERIKIETTISSQEICEEIYQLDENFILLCFSQFNLKQYSVSLLGETILLLEYDVYFQVKDQCKKKIQKVVGKNQFRIAFFQCSLWKIILINHQEIVIILESKMNEGNPQLKEFFKIDDVQYCEGGKSSKSLGIQSLYIIEGNNYLQLRWESNQKITQELFKSENQILKLILLQTCQNVMLITFQEENNQQPFQKLDNEIVLNQAFEVEQIHFFYNFLFLQNSTELIIRIDKHLIQKYEILNTKLIYMESYNLFYQIDKTKELVIFYRYFPISAFLQPTQKFVYFIQLFDGFEKQYMMCIKIQYEKTLDKKTPELINLQIEKDCSQNQKTILSIIDFQSFQQMPFSLYNNYTNGVINLSIWNEGEQENLCYYQLRMYNFKGKIQLKSMYTFTHVVFQVEDSIYFHDCQLKKIQLILNTHQYEVFQNQEYYFLIDKNKKQIRMIYIFSGITQQIVTHSNIEIISAQQIGEQIIIYIKNQQSPILISKKILEKIQNNYLSQKLKQPGEILYYQEIKSYKFIQYQNIFAFEQNEEVRCFQFSDVQIVQIKIYVKAHFMIFAVQIQTNSILLYHFDQFEIHQFHNYTLEDYSFSSPLRYSNNNFNLAILTVKNQFSFITLLSFTPFKISLMDIKGTDDTYFEFINNALFYFRNGQIRQHYLNKIVALIETNMSYQQTLISSHELKLMSTQRLDDDIPIKILIQNNCYQIQPLQNTISLNIKKNQNLQIKISEYFQGPINNLSIKENQKTKIRDPIHFIQEINICNHENFFCIRQQQLQKKIGTQELKSRFKAIILEDNTVFHILYSNTQDQLNYVLWIQDHQFLWFSQMEDELHIQLLYCIFKDNENCLEIQSQIINIIIIQPLQQNIIKTKNLVRLQNTLNQIYLFINDQNFRIIDLPGDYVDIQYIEQTQDNYVTFSYSENGISFQFEISIYLIDSNGFFLMFSKIITKEIEQIIPLFNRCQQIKLVSSRYNSNVTTVNLLFFINQNSFMIKLQIDVHNNSILSFHLTKQIRNPKLDFQSAFYYVDENYLIMDYLFEKTIFFYDLREDRLFYDYIYRLKSDIQMIRINTTHFISQNGLHVHLGIIQQYVIDFQNFDDNNFNFVLFAENDVSNAEISIYIIHEQPFYYHNPNIMLIQLTTLFVIIFYLRRQYCKNLKRKNQKKYMGQ